MLGFLRRSVDEFHQTIVMVTHEPSAAAYADRVIFLSDGQIVDSIRKPTAEGVLDKMKSLDTSQAADGEAEVVAEVVDATWSAEAAAPEAG